jgi:hypothetical protein
MNLQTTTMACLKALIAGGIAAIVPLSSAIAKAARPSRFDPLEAFLGTWIATNPNEKTPLLILKLKESNGELNGTVSHFKIRGTADRIIASPLTTPESRLSGFMVWEGGISFVGVSDPSLHDGRMDMHFEGTKVAYLLIYPSTEEATRIIADNRLNGFSPVIHLRREAEAGDARQQEKSPEKREVWSLQTEIINAAEFQYRFNKGVFADYPTLVRS